MSEKEENIGDIAKKLSDRHFQVLALALKTAQERVAEDPSAANISAMAAAKRAMDEAMAAAQAPAAEMLPNTQAVVRYLQQRGYKVKKSKVYADARAGKLPRGSCSVDDADRYATREDLPRLAEVAAGELDRLARERGEAEYRLLQKKYEKMEFELQKDKGQYLPRSEFEQELSARAAVLMHGLRHLAQSRAAELMEIGKEKGAQAVADRLQAEIEDLLDDYANRETFQVIVMPEEVK